MQDGERPAVVLLNISNSAGTSNSTWLFLDGAANSNFTNLNFTYDDDGAAVPYLTYDVSSGVARVAVNLTENGTIDLNYGGGITYRGDGARVFDSYDNFTSGALLSWTANGGTWVIQNGYADLTIAASPSIYYTTVGVPPYVVLVRWNRVNNANWAGLVYRTDGTISNSRFIGQATTIYMGVAGTETSTSYATTAGTWHSYMIKDSGNGVDFYADWVYKATQSSTTNNGQTDAGFMSWGTLARYDDFAVYSPNNVLLNSTWSDITAGSILSYGNNNTNNETTTISVPEGTSVGFNITSDQTMTSWIWTGATYQSGDGTTDSAAGYIFSTQGDYVVTAYGVNGNGTTAMITWNINVPPSLPASDFILDKTGFYRWGSSTLQPEGPNNNTGTYQNTDESNLFYEDGMFKVWYRGNDETNVNIQYATSNDTDLAVWDKHGSLFNWNQSWTPFMLRNNSISYIYYASNVDNKMHRAHCDADCGIAANWAYDGIALEPSGTELNTAGNKFVWFEDGEWRIIYEHYDTTCGGGVIWCLSYANGSSDGLTGWSKHGVISFSPDLSGGHKGGPQLYKSVNGTYYMWYHGGAPRTEIWLANSTNLMNWSDMRKVLPIALDFEAVQTADITLTEANGITYGLYEGVNGDLSVEAVSSIKYYGTIEDMLENENNGKYALYQFNTTGISYLNYRYTFAGYGSAYVNSVPNASGVLKVSNLSSSMYNLSFMVKDNLNGIGELIISNGGTNVRIGIRDTVSSDNYVYYNGTTFIDSGIARNSDFKRWTALVRSTGTTFYINNTMVGSELTAVNNITDFRFEVWKDNPMELYIDNLVSAPGNITSWSNNVTSNQTLNFSAVNGSTIVFNATSNQSSGTWNWYLDGANQNNDADTYTHNFDSIGNYLIAVNYSNFYGNSNTVLWNVTIAAPSGSSATALPNIAKGFVVAGSAVGISAALYLAYRRRRRGNMMILLPMVLFLTLPAVSTDVAASPGVSCSANVEYTSPDDTIRSWGSGAWVDGLCINQTVDNSIVSNLTQGIWFLNANLTVNGTATSIYINSSNVTEVRLNSTSPKCIRFEVNGKLEANNTKFVAWNTTTNAEETKTSSTICRSALYVNGLYSVANISDSNLSYMGYNNATGWYGFSVRQSRSGVITNNTLLHNHVGIHLRVTNETNVSYNTISNSASHGILLDTYGALNIVKGNHNITNNGGSGIALDAANMTNVSENYEIHDNTGSGILESVTPNRNDDNVIHSNHDIYNNNNGISVGRNSTSIKSNYNIYNNTYNIKVGQGVINTTISDNFEIHNGKVAEVYLNGNYTTLDNNTLRDGDIGMYLINSGYNVIRNNKIINMSWGYDNYDLGIFVYKGSSNNNFSNNNFSETGTGAILITNKSNNNSIVGNYCNMTEINRYLANTSGDDINEWRFCWGAVAEFKGYTTDGGETINDNRTNRLADYNSTNLTVSGNTYGSEVTVMLHTQGTTNVSFTDSGYWTFSYMLPEYTDRDDFYISNNKTFLQSVNTPSNRSSMVGGAYIKQDRMINNRTQISYVRRNIYAEYSISKSEFNITGYLYRLFFNGTVINTTSPLDFWLYYPDSRMLYGIDSIVFSNGSLYFQMHNDSTYPQGYHTVDATIVPSSDSVAVNISLWNTTGDFRKVWNESSSNQSVITQHVIGDFPANHIISIKKNGTAYNNYTSNSSGHIAFIYSDGYSEVQFEATDLSSTRVNPNLAKGYVVAGSAIGISAALYLAYRRRRRGMMMFIPILIIDKKR